MSDCNLFAQTIGINQSWTIDQIANYPPPTLETLFSDPELHNISLALDQEERIYGQYYPWKRDIFDAFYETSFNNTKVVIIGQDPYHQTITITDPITKNRISAPRAVGLAFSVRREDEIPSSLSNIYTEIANTVPGFVRPDHGDLREWAKQGVLLLNTALTVRPNQANSHSGIWTRFIPKVLAAINTVNPNCIYLLWGNHAKSYRKYLGKDNIVLEAAHPSGFSANRGFFGCNHFNLVNQELIKQGRTPINWQISLRSQLSPCPISIQSNIPQSNTNVLIPTVRVNIPTPIIQPNTNVLIPTVRVNIPNPIVQSNTNVPTPGIQSNSNVPIPMIQSNSNVPIPMIQSNTNVPTPGIQSNTNVPIPMIQSNTNVPIPMIQSNSNVPIPIVQSNSNVPTPGIQSNSNVPTQGIQFAVPSPIIKSTVPIRINIANPVIRPNIQITYPNIYK